MPKISAKEVLELSPIVPVIAIDEVEDALPLAKALLAGGIKIMEITLRTDAALKSIEVIAQADIGMHVGAGTVLNPHDFKKAVEQGAAFVFSPGISEALIETSKELEIALIPGVSTASEVMLAHNHGLDACKLFPATSVGGVSLLKSFGGPFPEMNFCPTGGIKVDNMKSFLALSNVLCVGSSAIVSKKLLEEKNFEEITNLAKEALELVRKS